MAQKRTDDNDGIHITRIVNTVPCTRHGAEIGKACWHIPSARGIVRAICDKRARHAGANGDISQDPKHGNAPVSNQKDYSR